MRLPLLLALLPQQGSDDPYVPRIEPASEEARQAIQRFRPAEGIALELFAAEPMLANPVAIGIDHDGALYVAETFRHHQGVTDIRDHMDWLDRDLAARTVEERRQMMRDFEGANYDPGYGRAFEQVRRIVDTDGDGVADEATVFATGFDDHAAGIGAGVLSYRGDVFYTCIPELWRLRDRDGDGVAEERDALSEGYGVHVALLGHDLHGLIVGPDRRLYFSVGDRGFHVETPGGTFAHPHTGAVLRCELDGSNLEVWHTGLRNPQELAFDDLGELWTGDNNSDGGDQARWVHVVEGADSGWRQAYQWITAPVARGPWNDEKLWHPPHAGQAAYVVPPVANLGHGPSGLTCYPGTGLAPRYAGHFFLCDFRGDAGASGIHTFGVEPKGAFWTLGKVEPFVWSTLVTDCDFGPDGALWFSDWVYGWEQTGKGRVYRAFDPERIDSPLVQETRALLAAGPGALDEDELVELLRHPDRRVRQEAHLALAERGDLGRMAAVAMDDSNPLLARLHALWAVQVRGRGDGIAVGPLRALAERPDPEVRAQALRALGDLRAPLGRTQVLAGLAAPEPRVRFHAALAAGRIGEADGFPAAVAPLRALLADAAAAADPNLRHAAMMGLVGCAVPEDVDSMATDDDPAVRIGAVLVLRRWSERSRRSLVLDSPRVLELRGVAENRIARFLLDDDPGVVLEAARAIHDVPMEPALEALARTRLDPGRLAAGERALARRVLGAAFRLGLADTLAGHAVRASLSEEARLEALDMLARWSDPPGRDPVTGEWRPIQACNPGALVELVERMASGPLLAESDRLVEGLARLAGVARARETAGALAGLVEARERGSGVKAAALAALELMEAPELVPAVRTALADPDGRVRAAALERLERLAPEEALASLDAIVEGGEVAERRAAYRILARHGEARAAELLAGEVTRLEQGLLPAELALDLVRAVEQHGDASLAARLEERRTASADAELAPWLDGLFGGDRDRGSAVFQRVDLSCTRCHAWWANASERVGPNLFGVGARLPRQQLLEAIVAPNRRTTPGYGARAFFLRDGRVVSGRVVEETEDLVRLFDAENNPIALERAQIDEERADLSSMPEDLAKTISREEMRDLLEYLGEL